MQPLAELTLTRSWHWGIAIVGASSGEVPLDLGADTVSVGRDVVVIRVRHAQDTTAERFEGEWATATIHLRSLRAAESTDRSLLCDEVIDSDRGTVSCGDAEDMFIVPAPGRKFRLIVTAERIDDEGLDEVWIDLVAFGD